MGVIINPGERPWYTSTTGITIVGTTKTYQTWDDMLQEQYPGKLAWVVDASGDPTVESGSALYTWREYQGWVKIYETEYMDPVYNPAINNFVGWIANPDQLNTLYPVGKDGMFAIIGTTDSMWVWDSETNSWVDSGKDEIVVNNKWDAIEDKPEYFPSTFELVIDLENNQTLSQTIHTLSSTSSDLVNRVVTIEEKLNDLKPSDIFGLQETLSALKPISFTANYTDLVNVPSAFTPTAHNHDWSDIYGYPNYTEIGHRHVWTDIDDIPDFDSRYALKNHQHSWSQITDTPDFALNNHRHDDVYAPIIHQHRWTDIQEVPEFAPLDHNHDTVYAPRIHTHTMTEIVNLTETLETLQTSMDDKMSAPDPISVGQMVVLGEDGTYHGQDIPGGDVTSEEFNNLVNRVTTVETVNEDLEQRVRALEDVVFEVDQLADTALDLLGYIEHRG